MKNINFAKNPIPNVLWKYGIKIVKKQFLLPVNKVDSNFKFFNWQNSHINLIKLVNPTHIFS